MQVPKQAKSHCVVFPGFTLTMEPELTEGWNTDSNKVALLEAVGLETGSSYRPSHLNVLQVIDTASLPLFWRSPLLCNLYPDHNLSLIYLSPSLVGQL